MLQTYQFHGARVVNTPGRFMLYQRATDPNYDDEITVYCEGVSIGLYRPGDSVQIPKEVDTWEIVPTAPQQRGLVVIGYGQVNTARVSGVVDVNDSAVARGLLGLTYFGSLSRQAVAGKFGVVGIYADNQTLLLRGVTTFAGASGTAVAWRGTGTPTTPLNERAITNKVTSGPVSASRLAAYDLTTSGAPGTEITGVTCDPIAMSYLMGANGSANIVSSLILKPGESFWVQHTTAATNTFMSVSAEVVA